MVNVKFKFWFVLVIGLLLLAACGSNNSESNTAGENAGSNAGSDSGSASETEAEPETVELDFWAWNPNEDDWATTIEAFNEEYPHIQINFIRHDAQEHINRIRIAIQGGVVPDIMGLELSTAHNFASILEPLSPYAEQSLGADWKSLFKAGPLAQVEDIDYRLLPTGVAVTPVILYDADMFAEVGVEPPTTYEELESVVRSFEEANLDGVIPRLGFPGGRAASFNDLYFNVLNQMAPGKLYQAAEGEIEFTDPDIIRATEAFKNLYTDNIVQDGNLSVVFAPQLVDMFFEEKRFPMIAVGGWVLNWVQNYQEGNYGIIPIPSFDGAQPTVQINADLPLGISKDSEHKEEAWKFIEFMAVGGYQDILSKSLIFLPIKEGMGMDLSLLEKEVTREGAQTVESLATDNVGGARFIEYPSTIEAIYLNLERAVTDQISVQEALEEIQKVSEQAERE